MPTSITDVVAFDVHLPTSRMLEGTDAINLDRCHSAAHVILRADHPLGAGSPTLLLQSQAPDDLYAEVRVHFSKLKPVELTWATVTNNV